jgi:uncharacterized protein (TIGR02145 family)
MKKLLILSVLSVLGLGWTGCEKDNTTANNNGGGSTTALYTVGAQFTDSRDGEVYETVIINGTRWMSENLRYLVTNQSTSNTTDRKYGYLYRQVVANTICPSGWHLSTDQEWKDLEMYLELSASEANASGYRGDSLSYKLMSTSGWNNSSGTNVSGFNALSAGEAISLASNPYLGTSASFWTSTDSVPNGPFYRTMGVNINQGAVKRDAANNNDRYFACRCVED